MIFSIFFRLCVGLLDRMGGFWSTVANYFKEDDNILGYELINEPWAGDIYADPGLMLPTIADKKNLQPAYDHLNKAIRAKDNEHRYWLQSTASLCVRVGVGGEGGVTTAGLSSHDVVLLW